jgi:hypothetical protein
MIRHRRTTRGTTLLEMVIVLTLLAAVSVIGVGLLRTTLNMTQALADSHTARAQHDNVMLQLRQDVWCASAATAADPGQLHLQTRQGLITWRYQPQERRLSRSLAGAATSATAASTGAATTATAWHDLGPVPQFAPIPGGVRVQWIDSRNKSAITEDLTSQLLLAAGAAGEDRAAGVAGVRQEVQP